MIAAIFAIVMVVAIFTIVMIAAIFAIVMVVAIFAIVMIAAIFAISSGECFRDHCDYQSQMISDHRMFSCEGCRNPNRIDHMKPAFTIM